MVDEQDDAGEIRKLLAAEPQYLDIYHQILDFCCEEGGRSAKEIDRLVNDSPLLEEPRGIPAISSVAWSARARLSGAAVGAPRRLAAT